MDKVHGGTPRGGRESMCKSCRLAQVTKGINNQELVFCRASGNGLEIKFPVVECSIYDDKSRAPLYEMQSIAWIVKSRNHGPMGFTEGGKTEIVIDPPSHPDQPGTPLHLKRGA
jgi:hypothetical protein